MSEQTLLRGVYIHNPLPGMKNSKEKDTPKTGKQSSAVKGKNYEHQLPITEPGLQSGSGDPSYEKNLCNTKSTNNRDREIPPTRKTSAIQNQRIIGIGRSLLREKQLKLNDLKLTARWCHKVQYIQEEC